jgi:methyltransferase-like protein/2-polyprenyl-3-methyl-5-hydroxy-6-metoxy-1,4-benzoquinol methylase
VTDSGVDDSYDDVPYPDLCHSFTHPGRLAAIGVLLNTDPVPVHNCRVLEIGCAGGGNLIPMAFSLPNSTFVGLDQSERQVEAAEESARILGLRNVRFHPVNLMDVTPEFGTFDYIIAHGVYSWVPQEVRNKLLSVCQHNLSSMGIAYVSYNTLPGWHMILMMREMMLYHTRDLTEPRDRAQKGRSLIRGLQSMLSDADHSVFAAFLEAYIDTNLGHFPGNDVWEDSALLHDELGAVNEPVYFHQFVEHARQHGLQYLADATFPQAMTRDLSTDTVDRLHDMANDDIEFEQYVDYVCQQSFRRTLLCHEDVHVQRTPLVTSVGDLYVTSRARWVEDDDGNGSFRTSDGSTYSSGHPVTTAALKCLSEISPQAIHFPVLIADASQRVGTREPDDATADRVATDLLEAAGRSNQQTELLAYDPALAVLPSELPLASPIARLQSYRSSVVSNLRHEQMTLNGLSRALLPLLDGRHTRDDLLRELLNMLDDGQLSSSGQEDTSPQRIQQALAHDIEHTLGWLARAAILLK